MFKIISIAPLHARERGLCHFLISFVKFSEAEGSARCAPLLSFPLLQSDLLNFTAPNRKPVQSKTVSCVITGCIVFLGIRERIHLEASPPPTDSETTSNQADVPAKSITQTRTQAQVTIQIPSYRSTEVLCWVL